MLHATPRTREEQRTERTKERGVGTHQAAVQVQVCYTPRSPDPRQQPRPTKVWDQPGSRESRKEDPRPHTPLLHREYNGATTSNTRKGPKERERRAGKEKDRDTHQSGGREKCMPGRRASQQGVEERVKSDEDTKETGGSQQPSKGRTQGRGHGRHKASTTPHRSTGEGSTRGTGERRHHAPRHAPHRHHTHRTHPHPRPQHVASGPRQPAQRAGNREGGAPEPRRPPPPPWRAAPHRAREPRGQCWAPTPAHPRPQHVGGGTRQPAQRAGSWGRGSA